MGLGERLRRRALSGRELVGVTRMRFEGDEVAFVDEWLDLEPGERLWWQLFGACEHAMHIANNLGRRHPGAQAIREAFVTGDPSFLDLQSEFTIVAALPHAPDEMTLELWSAELPFTQSALNGRRAKRGQYAVPAAGLIFAHLLDEIDGKVLGAAVTAYGEMIEEFDWQPGGFPSERKKSLYAGIGAMASLVEQGLVPDLFGFGDQLGKTPSDGSAERSVLLEASDRLDEHVLDGPFDDYFKLILLACSAAGYGLLVEARQDLLDRSDLDDLARLGGLFDEPAAADRAVRTATWMMLCAVIAERWHENWQEIVDLTSTALPLDPASLAAAAEQIELHAAWDSAGEPDEEGSNTAALDALAEHSWGWLARTVLQSNAVEPLHELEHTPWTVAFLNALTSYFDRLEELEHQHPDVVP